MKGKKFCRTMISSHQWWSYVANIYSSSPSPIVRDVSCIMLVMGNLTPPPPPSPIICDVPLKRNGILRYIFIFLKSPTVIICKCKVRSLFVLKLSINKLLPRSCVSKCFSRVLTIIYKTLQDSVQQIRTAVEAEQTKKHLKNYRKFCKSYRKSM